MGICRFDVKFINKRVGMNEISTKKYQFVSGYRITAVECVGTSGL
jgi:hypothetical protein